MKRPLGFNNPRIRLPYQKRKAQAQKASVGTAEETINLTADHEEQRRRTIDKLTAQSLSSSSEPWRDEALQSHGEALSANLSLACRAHGEISIFFVAARCTNYGVLEDQKGS